MTRRSSSLASTEAAAVFSVLRSRSVSLRGDLRPLLELESGSNDPMAVFLTVALIELIVTPSAGVLSLVPVLLQQAAVGGAVGWAAAKAAVSLVNRLRLECDGLDPVVTLAAVVLAYTLTAGLGGSGFLAVYLMGLVMGRSEFLHKKSLMRLHDAIAWLGQISMFLVLGLLVFPSALLTKAVPALIVTGVVVFVARPLAVFLTLAVTRFPEGAPADGRSLIDLELPEGTLVVLISRNGEFVVPQGSTLLNGGDEVLVLADDEALPVVLNRLLGSKTT